MKTCECEWCDACGRPTPDVDDYESRIEALTKALQWAVDWIERMPHGDNCYVSNHYEGDPGNRCNCGKESLLKALASAADAEGTNTPKGIQP